MFMFETAQEYKPLEPGTYEAIIFMAEPRHGSNHDFISITLKVDDRKVWFYTINQQLLKDLFTYYEIPFKDMDDILFGLHYLENRAINIDITIELYENRQYNKVQLNCPRKNT